MKPVKKDHWICGKCGNDEAVLEGETPKIIQVSVMSHKYQFCPDCVYAIEPWKQHVNEEHLRDFKKDEIPIDKSGAKFVDSLCDRVGKLGLKKMELNNTGPEVDVLEMGEA